MKQLDFTHQHETGAAMMTWTF